MAHETDREVDKSIPTADPRVVDYALPGTTPQRSARANSGYNRANLYIILAVVLTCLLSVMFGVLIGLLHRL